MASYVVSSGVVSSGVSLLSYDSMNVLSAGMAADTVIRGSSYTNSTYASVQHGGSAVRTQIDFGYLAVLNGGYAVSTTVNSNTAYVNVVSGGLANSTTVKNGGRLYVSAGGSAT
ncbi:MAG: hypothetical protein IKO93_06185, partial [Lentisphaeria bacterium]|nr:hypothetical protein [Lentisphaeria bacterium]